MALPQTRSAPESIPPPTSRQRLLGAALELFGDKGYAATSTREIASQAGLTLGMIWKCFGTKDKLRRAVDDHVAETFESAFDEVPDEFDELSRWLLDRDQDLRQRHQAEFRYLRRCLTDAPATAAKLLRSYLDHYRRFHHRLADKGQLRGGLAPDFLALSFLLTGIGILVAGDLLHEYLPCELNAESGDWNPFYVSLLQLVIGNAESTR